MAWPSEAGAIAKIRGKLPRDPVDVQPESQATFSLLAAVNSPPWTVASGVHARRSSSLVEELTPLRSRKGSRRVAPSRFYGSFVGTYRLEGTAQYRFYRSNVAPPLETDTPYATSASLPSTPANTFANGTWYISVAFFNGILSSGFLPLGPNGETYIRLEISGGVVLGNLPNGPIGAMLELRPGGVVRVRAFYFQTDALRATEWAITYTTNGATPGTPPAVSPTIGTAMVPAGGAAVLEYDLPAQADGTTVKVRLQARRNDSGTWRYSENSTVMSIVVDAAGPTAPLVLQNWPGRLPEGV